ncbi:iron reductase domain protein [Xylariaceae sp. FL1651]|nr:iron reductase domain protein [Xylariaceae sp. FL1651]
MQSLLASAALSALTYSALGAAATASRCPTDNVCYQVGVPETSASSGSGNIYLQLRAPASYSWVALGTGQRMSGSNIFVMYADGAGNVTVSARKGANHVMPQHQTTTQLDLLAGSGIIDGGNTMLANVRCANCESWDGGSLSLSSTSSPFIAAWKEGDALNSKQLDASIAEHDSHSQFTFDLSTATITDDTNPFVDTSSGGSGGSGSGNTTSPSGSGSGSGSNGGDSQGSGSSSAVPASIREIPTIQKAHGILMSIVMVILYPLGSILMPLFGNWVLHAVWQSVSFLAMWAAFGLGIILSQRTGYNFTENHTLLGTVVVTLFGVQPIGGYIHHAYYLKHQKRGIVSYSHIWYGRTLMILGIVNGGLGLQLAGAGKSLIIAYSVVAGVIFLVYIGGAVFGEVKRGRKAKRQHGNSAGDMVRKNSA